MPGLVPGIHVRMIKIVDGRDIRTFTRVVAGYAPAMTI
jgi:hypothetical protein